MIKAFLFLHILSGVLFGDVPKLINYQSKLTNAVGQPLADGGYQLEFRLFDSPEPSEGEGEDTFVWGEHRTITVIKGVFNVALGSGEPLDGAAVNDIGFAFGSADRFLQATVVSGPDVTEPKILMLRQQMASVPFSMATAFAPTAGAIMLHHTFGGLAPVPRGWLICDGKSMPEEPYDEIHGAGAWRTDGFEESRLVGKASPDLIGRYPVGADQVTWDGQGEVPVVGNPGHRINLHHSHTVDPYLYRWLRRYGRGYAKNSYDGNGNLVSFSNGQPNTVKRIVINTAQEEAVGNYFTDKQLPGTDNQLSENQSIHPESIEVLYIIKL